MADANIVVPSHPFDETGTLSENLILNEQRILEARNVRAVIPRYGSFFADSFVMRDANGNVVPKTKYQQALYSDVLSAKVGQDVIGGVILTDATVPSPVYIDYRCVGGPWGASNEVILDLFKKLQVDSRPVSWGNILGKPDGYTPAHHLQDIGDLYGAEFFVAALDRLAQAFLMGDTASHDEIWRRIDEVRQIATDSQSGVLATLKAYVDAQIAPVKTSVIAVDTRVTNVRAELVQDGVTTNNRITSVQSTLQTNINAVDARLSAVRTELILDTDAVEGRVGKIETDLPTIVDTLNKAIGQVRTDFVAGDATLKARIDGLSNYGDVSTLIDTKIATAKTEWQAADKVIDTKVDSVKRALETSIGAVKKTAEDHIKDWANPHHVVASEVGAYSTTTSDNKERDIYIILNSLTSRLDKIGA